ncbi:autotransporter domain-containing protein [Candidatus Tisiphia endosymbiont of Beris chalybata]|uniref:autotransporter domain-containing protein n=1 Tax=Candidatus Tisiphia endosymbiont of Beris chalybata TaxID=3066262 RepID=UPI00312C83D9
MRQKNKIFASMVLATTFLTSSSAIAAPKENFTNVISFGDSFTAPNNSWAALITERYGFKFVNGQTFFDSGNSTSVEVDRMFNQYIQIHGGKIDPNALYLVNMGPSAEARLERRLRNAIQGKAAVLVVRHHIPVETALSQVLAQITNEDGSVNAIAFPGTADLLTRIKNTEGNFIHNISVNGANYIVVFNHVDEYYRHLYENRGLNDQQNRIFGQILSKLLNKAMMDGIAQHAPDANVIYIDYARLVEEMSNNPKAYLSDQDIAGTYRDFGVFGANYPTEAAQKITAQYVESVIESPSRVAFVRELPIAVGTNALQTMHASAHNNVLHPVEQFYTADIGGDYIYNSTKTISKKELGIKKANTGSAYAQINYKMNENFNLGLQLNGAKSNMDFKHGHGKADMKEYLVSINGTYKFDNPVFIYAAVGAGQIKYDIKRKIALGLATREERGKPSGVHYLGTVGVGYNYIDETKLVVTPFFNVNYQEVSVKSYKEVGDIRSTTMEFNIPNRKSLITEIGATLAQAYQVQDNLTLIPSLTLSYGYECINSIKKQAKGRVSDMPRLFSVPTYKVDESNFTLSGEVRAKSDSYINYGIRASMQLTKRTKQYSAGLFAGVTF